MNHTPNWSQPYPASMLCQHLEKMLYVAEKHLLTLCRFFPAARCLDWWSVLLRLQYLFFKLVLLLPRTRN